MSEIPELANEFIEQRHPRRQIIMFRNRIDGWYWQCWTCGAQGEPNRESRLKVELEMMEHACDLDSGHQSTAAGGDLPQGE